MARTDLTPITPKGPYPGTVAPTDLDLTFTAADAANKNQFAFTGRQVILVQNVHASAAKTFTLTSVADPQARTADIATYSLAAGKVAAFLATNLIGWAQSGGKFYLEGEDNNIKFCILTLP